MTMAFHRCPLDRVASQVGVLVTVMGRDVLRPHQAHSNTVDALGQFPHIGKELLVLLLCNSHLYEPCGEAMSSSSTSTSSSSSYVQCPAGAMILSI